MKSVYFSFYTELRLNTWKLNLNEAIVNKFVYFAS